MTPASYLRQFIPTPPPPLLLIKIPNLLLERERNRVKGWYSGLYYKSTSDSDDPLAACYVCIKGGGWGGGGTGIGRGEKHEGVGEILCFSPLSPPQCFLPHWLNKPTMSNWFWCWFNSLLYKPLLLLLRIIMILGIFYDTNELLKYFITAETLRKANFESQNIGLK